jgi:hypothetical protein
MKVSSMKALSLAVVALAGFGMAGAAFGQTCDNTNLAAWNGGTQGLSGGTVAVVAGGLEASSPSACRMEASLGTAASSIATVTFNDTTDETRYRAQFLIDAGNLTTFPAGRSVQIFTANSTAPFPAVNQTLQMLRVNLIGSASGKFLSFIAACNNGGSNQCSVAIGPLVAGTNRVEFDLNTSASTGYVHIWLNNTTEGTPTDATSINNINNIGWVGVHSAKLGLASGGSTFRVNNHGQAIKFDAFDSRRQTFIGG